MEENSYNHSQAHYGQGDYDQAEAQPNKQYSEDEDSAEIDFGLPEGAKEQDGGMKQEYRGEDAGEVMVMSIEGANDKMIFEIENLIQTMETKIEEFREFKEREKIQKRNDDPLYDRDSDLQIAQYKATRIKNEIKSMKKALFTAYDIDGIIKAENELKKLQKEADGLESEAYSLRKVKNANKQALKELDADAQITMRYKKSQNALSEAKTALKQQQELLKISERETTAEHNQVLQMEERCRQLSSLLIEHKRGGDAALPAPEIDENEIQQLEKEIEQLETQKREGEEKFKKVMTKMKADVKKAATENDMMRIKVKEKDQEARLNELKYRQLSRKVPYKTLKPLFTVRDKNMKNSKSTHYASQPLTSRGPFAKNDKTKIPSQTQFKIKKRKLPSVSKGKRRSTQSSEIVEEEPEDDRQKLLDLPDNSKSQNNTKTNADEHAKPFSVNRGRQEIQNIRDEIDKHNDSKENLKV
ncbi:unnamed protein product [Moneuplotes crassus]|uniref:Uncharacterized protein n=1 Tax=Euplotes crassus TaxID=5936 RepID=A0AAD1UIS2_EUPCR|nr:unnamed protein product [Moneuplotes crassus]